jgi:hypothetical protein
MAGERQNSYWQGGNKQSLQGIADLSGTPATQTHAVGVVEKNMRVKAIRFYGSVAVTATTLTAEVFARTTAGAAGNTLQSAATDIDFASDAAAKAGVAASLTATPEDLRLVENQLLEVVFTAASVTVGPDDLLTKVEFEPIT